MKYLHQIPLKRAQRTPWRRRQKEWRRQRGWKTPGEQGIQLAFLHCPDNFHIFFTFSLHFWVPSILSSIVSGLEYLYLACLVCGAIKIPYSLCLPWGQSNFLVIRDKIWYCGLIEINIVLIHGKIKGRRNTRRIEYWRETVMATGEGHIYTLLRNRNKRWSDGSLMFL